MLVCYVEGDMGHLLNEELHNPQFRTRVRGTACSFHMPWSEILDELQRHCIQRDICEVLPRNPECLKYILRVHLRVDKGSMERALKQLTVRPYVLLQLLYFLIEQNHEVFRGKGNAKELRERMERSVKALSGRHW